MSVCITILRCEERHSGVKAPASYLKLDSEAWRSLLPPNRGVKPTNDSRRPYEFVTFLILRDFLTRRIKEVTGSTGGGVVDRVMNFTNMNASKSSSISTQARLSLSVLNARANA